jgi:hypothetical protein
LNRQTVTFRISRSFSRQTFWEITQLTVNKETLFNVSAIRDCLRWLTFRPRSERMVNHFYHLRGREKSVEAMTTCCVVKSWTGGFTFESHSWAILAVISLQFIHM